jgi:hypothetical protein
MIFSAVIPGRVHARVDASPESSREGGMWLWIPGPALRAVPE